MFGFSIVKPPFSFTDVKTITIPAICSVNNSGLLFTEQIAGIVMVFTSVKLNGGFTIEKPNILRPSLKMTILQPLLTTSRPLDTTSSGIILIF